jgi:arginyl-tRNA synthetase
LRAQVKTLLSEALGRAVSDGALTLDELPEVVVERARDASHGDFACPSALALARLARRKPRDIATAIVERLAVGGLIERAEIAGPGFINLFLTRTAYQTLLQTIRSDGSSFGRVSEPSGKRIQVEFVSANPTGPLHVGHGRGAAYGSALADLLEAAGHDVQREYYVNDAGRQMHILAASVWLRYLEIIGVQVDFPSNGYQGDYVYDIARELVDLHAEGLRADAKAVTNDLPLDEPRGGDKERHIDGLIERAQLLLGETNYRTIFDCALINILKGIEVDLADFGVTFQRWYSERSLVESGQVEKCIGRLVDAGFVYDQGGAQWFKSTDFGDEKDRVVIRDNGQGTYFASDIAYHLDKLGRGFDQAINVWGADHHGYIARVKGSLSAAGEDPDRLVVQLVQFANLLEDGEKVSMTTRGGQFVTLRELYSQVGRDAARFFYTMRKNDQHLDFDLELATRQSKDNPVFYVQYAHARICSMLQRAQEQGFVVPSADVGTDLGVLRERHEHGLMTELSRFPEVVESAAEDLSPHEIAQYLRDLATALHSWYDSHKAIVDDEGLRNARLTLADATRVVLANGLTLLGVTAPESM